MCRLFAAFSVDPIPARRYLIEAPQSLLAQSQIDKKRKQGDGWGIAWFRGGRPEIFKRSQPIYRDHQAIALAAGKSKGQILLAHIRWASNPLKLPRQELIGLSHTQPFRHGKWLFVHNGTLYIPREVKAALGPWAKFIKGNNDSEVLFYWLLKHLRARRGARAVAAGVRQSLRSLNTVWQNCRQRYALYRYPYHGLNWVLTDGRRMIAFCFADPRGFGKTRALCRPGQPYYELQVKCERSGVVVASEPLDPSAEWSALRNGQMLYAERENDAISAKITQVI